MTVETGPYGYVNYQNRYSDIPVEGAEGYGSTTNSWQYNRSYTASTTALDLNRYTDASRPRPTNKTMWGSNGFFYNGPSADGMLYGNSEINQILSYVNEWADPLKRAYLDRFSGLLLKYGHTNSPGTLWAIAATGMDPENETVKQVLQQDAAAAYNDYATAAPKSGDSVSAEQTDFLNNTLWQPFEFAARNLFAAVSMPLEATQGAVRGIGGELTDENAPWFDFEEGRLSGALAQFGSLFLPPLGALANQIRGDNEFVNPWEQTEFGQTLLAASGGQGFAAFTQGQAGLDTNRARDELLQQNPQIAALPKETIKAMAEEYAQEQGYYSEPGWFIDETSTVGEAQRQAAFNAWAIPGPNKELTAWTLGRGIFSNIGGPEWEGYNVASGFVDAVAAVVMDPTIIGAKIGLPSKLIKNVTALRGADKVVLVGKERQKALRAYETSVRSLQPAFKFAQEGKVEEARRAAYPVLRDAFGRVPTEKEIDEFLDEPEFFNIATLNRMSIEEIAETVYQAKRGQITAERMATVKGDANGVAGLARDARRTRLEADRIDGVVSRETVIDPATITRSQEEAGRAATIWNDYINGSWVENADGTRSFDNSSYFQWVDEYFGYDEAAKAYTRADDYALFYALKDQFDAAAGSGLSRNYDANTAHVDRLLNDSVGGRTWSKTRQIDPVRVERDIARLYLDEQSETLVRSAIDTDLSGMLLDGIPTRSNPVLGAVNADGAIFYAPTGATLKVVSASEAVPDAVRVRLRQQTIALLDRDDMRFITPARDFIDYETVAGQASRQVEDAVDIRAGVERFFQRPVLTYNDLLTEFAKYGIDAGLDDLLRGLPKSMRVDGITDVNGIAGRTWVGHSDKLLAYKISQTGQDAGIAARNVTDTEAAFAGLTTAEQIALGYRGLDPDELVALGISKAESAAIDWNKIEGLRRDAVFKGAMEDVALRDNIRKLDEEWADPVSRMKSTIGWQAGLRYGLNGVTLDEKGMRQFLFGTGPFAYAANRTMDALSDFIDEGKRVELQQELVEAGGDMRQVSDKWNDFYRDAVGQVRMLSGGKWSADTAKAIVDNAIAGGGRDGLIDALAPRLGLDVTQGSVSRNIRAMPTDNKTAFRSWRGSSPVTRTVITKLQKSLNVNPGRTFGALPTARVTSLSNSADVIDALISYGKFAGIDEGDIAKYVGEVTLAEGLAGQAAVNRNALTGLFNDISDKLVEDLSQNADFLMLFKGAKGEARKQALIRQIHNSTAIFMGGKYKARRDMDEALATDSTPGQLIGTDGGRVELPSLVLETEIANGYVNLPSVDEWRAALNRFTLAMQRYEKVGKTWDFAFDVYDDFFRTSLLVFRGAYLLRNAAEMQVRMYLNGHHSVFNSPMTMIGMVISDNRYAKRVNKYNENYKNTADTLSQKFGREATDEEITAVIGAAPEPPRILDSFNRFSNTVLDTRFNTGPDGELAAANYAEDWYKLIREANSLTDPRVYKYAARTNWREIEYGNANFNAGWANELIMLERSKIARLVLGGSGGSYGSALNGILDENAQRRLARELMDSDEYADVREQLIGAFTGYRDILRNEDDVVDYLFTNPNSVLNRVIKYTNNNPELLEYIRTGRLRYGQDEVFVPRRYAKPKDKIERFSVVLGRVLDNDASLKTHLQQKKVTVPWTDYDPRVERASNVMFDWFFEVSNKFERLSSVGPEFKMAYWDRVAELAPGLRRSDVDQMLSAAQTTLSPLKRLVGDKFVTLGKNHPAWEALNKAKKENSDGLLTLDEIHSLAARYASEEVAGLFYDAARRNNFWYQMRLIWPFGQAWGNTMNTWSRLAQKTPLRIYEVQKLFNALQEEDSQAIYEASQNLGIMSPYYDYGGNSAPWQEDLNGGFFYSNEYGDTTFMLPFIGRAASLPVAAWGMLNDADTSKIGIGYESPAASLNLAFGGESIFPGFGMAVPMALNSGVLPDNMVTSQLRQIAAPFGDKDIFQSGTPAWAQKLIAGADVIPGIGPVINGLFGALAPGVKGKNQADAAAMLSAGGGYQDMATNPLTQQKFKEDVSDLAALLTLTTGLIQNVSPSTPVAQYSIELTPGTGKLAEVTPQQYALGYFNTLYYGGYLPRNGYDSTLAKTEMVTDFGLSSLFAIMGNIKGFTRKPTSAALRWAQDNPQLAAANRGIFEMFFPGGDASQAEAIRWLRKEGFYQEIYKNPDDFVQEFFQSLERIQRLQVDSRFAAGYITDEDRDQMLEEISDRYVQAGQSSITIINYSDELERFNRFASLPEVKDSDAGIAFRRAWLLRDQALARVREATGDPDSGLGSKAAESVRTAYLQDIDNIVSEHPDFKLLATYFRKEWR